MSETLTTFITNAETNETIERDLTSDEIADLEALQVEAAEQKAAADARAAARTSALAKLADLGLTAEEIAAL
jgi:FMN-dependent NADH-azoreductase